MNIFLDTSQKSFVACLFDKDYFVKKQVIKDTTHKVEEIPLFFNDLLIDNKINIHDIKNFYINIGPGSFTGSRISLVYVRTIAQITGAKVWTTNSFKLLKCDDDFLIINANKNKSFKINKQNINHLSKTILISKSIDEKSIDYKGLIFNFKDSLKLFTEEELLSIKPEYGSMPQIGSEK